jgi:hypothetical protein
VMSLDAFGPYPPISESHVDMDGAWALYEAWVKIQLGKADIALVYAYGKSSPGDIRRVLTRQLDPYTLGPLWLDSVSVAALQAPSGARRRDVHRSADGRGRGGQSAGRAGEPVRPAHRRPRPRDPAEGAGVRGAPAQARLPTDHRRRRRADPRRRRRGPRAERAPGVDPGQSTTASRPRRSACATSPVRCRPSWLRPRPAWPTARSTSPSSRVPLRPSRSYPALGVGLDRQTVREPRRGGARRHPEHERGPGSGLGEAGHPSDPAC